MSEDKARNTTRTVLISCTRMTAMNNWWDGGEPKAYNSENQLSDGANVLVEPVLSTDPR